MPSSALKSSQSGNSPHSGLRSLFVETYGCQMNEYDSSIVKSLLKDQSGLEAAGRVEDADVILLNTCAVRENAHSKIYSRLRQLETLKAKRPGLVLGLLGCMAQNLAEDLWAQNLPLDFIAGPDAYRSLPALIDKVTAGRGERLEALDLDIRENYSDILPLHDKHTIGSFVTIMRGCNNFCTFCVVPYTRGRERSRSPQEIVDEVKQAADAGRKEVTLLGQNVNSYRYINDDFTSLVERLLAETSIERIRFTSPHPKDFSERLLALMAAEERFCSHIHLPLQAGNSRVLKAMKRNYSKEEFIELALKMRDMVPGLSITTDLIVGFPSETADEFKDTLDVYEKVAFDSAFMFKYSPRQGTLAIRKFEDDVPEEEKSRRLEEVVSLQNRVSARINAACVGQTYDVLTESLSRRSDSDLKGRTSSNKVVIFPVDSGIEGLPSAEVGQTYRVKIKASTSATLLGSLQAK